MSMKLSVTSVSVRGVQTALCFTSEYHFILSSLSQTQAISRNLHNLMFNWVPKKLRFSSSNRRSLLLKAVVEHWRASKPAACHHIMSWCQQTNRVELVGQGGKSSSVGGGDPRCLSANSSSDLWPPPDWRGECYSACLTRKLCETATRCLLVWKCAKLHKAELFFDTTAFPHNWWSVWLAAAARVILPAVRLTPPI